VRNAAIIFATIKKMAKCKRLLGIKYIYEKEKRPAYRLFVGAVVKKIVKLR